MPGDCHPEAGSRGSGHLQRAVRRADRQASAEGPEGVEERVEVLGVDHDGSAEEQVEEALVQRLGQIGEQHVVPLHQGQGRGRPPDGHHVAAAPASLTRLHEDLEHGLLAPGGQVGGDPGRLVGQREGVDAGSGEQRDPGADGRAQRRDEPVAVVVERRCGPRGKVGVEPGESTVERQERVGLRRHEAAAGHRAGQVAPLGTAAHPARAGTRPHRAHAEVAGAAGPPGGGAAGDLKTEWCAHEGGPRPLRQVVVEPGQPLAPDRLGLRAGGSAEPECHRRAVLAQPRDRAGAGAEDPVGGLVDLGVELHVVGRRCRPPDLRRRGQAARGLVDDLEPEDVAEQARGACHRGRVVELGEVVVVQRIADIHGAVIFAPGADIAPASSTPGPIDAGVSRRSAARPARPARHRAPTARRRSRGWRGGPG